MSSVAAQISIFSSILGFTIFAVILSFALAPLLTYFLYKYNITVGRRGGFDPVLASESKKEKLNTPTMGGVLIILVIALITYFFNWERSFTWVPIGVMLLSASLGAVDDLLNIFGRKRRSRTLGQTLKLIKVHKNLLSRVWLRLTLPWVAFKRMSLWIGSHPGKGVHVHEKLLLQFLAGAISAWWVYFKLAENWRYLFLPFDGYLDLGWLIIPLIILVVMFTANAVNIADGMDGLSGGMLITTFSALTLLSWMLGYYEIGFLNATTVGALITYTYFNIKPARFQMGDVGSLGLGALLAINAIVINQMIALFFLGFMFYIEAFSVLIQLAGKRLLGKKIFSMAPIHHHFEDKGWSEEKTVMRFWIIHLAFVIFGVWIALH